MDEIIADASYTDAGWTVPGLGGSGNRSPVPEFGGEKADSGKRGIGFRLLLRRAPRDGDVDAVAIGSV